MPSANYQVARASCWTSIIGLSQCDAEHPTYRTSELHHFKYNDNIPQGSEAELMLPDIDYQHHRITMLDPSHKAATARCQVFLTDIRQKNRPHHCYQSIMPDTIIKLPQHDARHSIYTTSEAYQSVSHPLTHCVIYSIQ